MTTDKNINRKNASAGRSAPVRQRRSAAAAREHILQAAEQILTARGPMELKLTVVADAACMATATVMHHFGAIDGVQTALMERMVTRLAARVIAISAASPVNQPPGPEADVALFDAFEEPGAARLAAWLVMTGEAVRLAAVEKAVTEVVDLILTRMVPPPPRGVVEDVVLGSITMALGAGLFGQPLSLLLGRPAGAARAVTLTALQALAERAGLVPAS